MKRLLLGSTALMAAGAFAASPAAAEEKIKLNVGGYYQSVVSFVDQDVDGAGSPEFHEVNVRQEGEVQFTGSTTLDNGLTVGVNIQLEAVAQGDQLDEQFIFFSGDFGRINIGAENSASYLMSYIAPGVGLGVNSPNFFLFSPVLATANLTTAVSDANKLTYFTPRFSGFQLGVSYTPNIDERGGDRQTFGLNTDDDAGDFSDYFSVGANFVETFNNVDLAVFGGYERGDSEGDRAAVPQSATNVAVQAALVAGGTTAAQAASAFPSDAVTAATFDDDETWHIGLNIGSEGFLVGGSYGEDNNGLNGDNDSTAWDLGISYSTGPWGISLGFFHAERDLGTGAGEDESDLWEAGASYSLGPGITIVGSVQYFDEDLDSTNDSDGFAGAIQTKLSF